MLRDGMMLTRTEEAEGAIDEDLRGWSTDRIRAAVDALAEPGDEFDPEYVKRVAFRTMLARELWRRTYRGARE